MSSEKASQSPTLIPVRDKILDAAEMHVLDHGANSLTLEAVAKGAEISKGGLLYHFPSKDDLIRGLVKRIHEQWMASLEAARQKEKGGKQSMAHVLFRDAFDPEVPWDSPEWKRHQRLVAALAAAIAHNPHLMECCRENYQNFLKAFETDELPLGHSLIMMSVYDAIWWSSVFGTYTLNETHRKALEVTLRSLLQLDKDL